MIRFAQIDLERDRRISDHLVRLVQIIFALVLAQSLFHYRAVVVDPTSARNRSAAAALASVFLMTVLSWIDWHITMELHPYDRRARVEWVRLTADLLIVVTYAYLLFAIEPLRAHSAGDVGGFLLGFPIVFALYLVSGLARKARYGVAASRSLPIVVFLLLFSLLWLTYRFVPRWHTAGGDLVFVGLSAAGVVGYRWFRARYRARIKRRKKRGGRVAVDIDGVLADQVGKVLPRINDRLGLSLRREDVTDWRLKLPDGSDIAVEIEAALKESDYVLSMEVLPGARQFLNRIYPRHEVVILTARPPEALIPTQAWLERNGLPYDHFCLAGEGRKSLHGCEVLVDDYLGNVLEFLSNTDGFAILVDQPWNRDHSKLQKWLESNRAAVAKSLVDAQRLLAERPGR